MNTRPREMDDGSLLYPNRGKEPPIPPNYTRDPGNPFIMRPILPLCIYRSEGERDCACEHGKKEKFYACDKGRRVNMKECTNCPLRQEQ